MGLPCNMASIDAAAFGFCGNMSDLDVFAVVRTVSDRFAVENSGYAFAVSGRNVVEMPWNRHRKIPMNIWFDGNQRK